MPRADDGRSGPRWRAILEARWRIRQEVTELSLAYHAVTADASAGIEDSHARQLLNRAVAARQRLADTEDALGRLAAGGFGRCEQCGVQGLKRKQPPDRRAPGFRALVGARGGTHPGRSACSYTQR